MDGATEVPTSQFGDLIIAKIQGTWRRPAREANNVVRNSKPSAVP